MPAMEPEPGSGVVRALVLAISQRAWACLDAQV
jgi:hypothetical protein